MPDSRSTTDELNAVFDALANERRRDMVHQLSMRPATISQLAAPYGITLPSMHRHLAVLERANLIRRVKVGRSQVIGLNKRSLRLAQDWIGRYQAYWGNDQESLENFAASLRE